MSGVPQGSVLSHMLFVLYIDPLPKVVRVILYIFADDTKLLKRITRLDNLIIEIILYLGPSEESELDSLI